MGWGCLYELESLEMEQRYECWSVKGTTAVSPLLAITHKLWMPLTRRRRPHTCTTQRNTWRLYETALDQSFDLYLGSFDGAKILKLHWLTFWATKTNSLCFCFFFYFLLSTLMNCLKHLISTQHIEQLEQSPNPLHGSSTSDSTNLFFPLVLFFHCLFFSHPTLFHFLPLCAWLLFAVHPSMKTQWKTTSRKLVNYVKSKQIFSEKIDRWEEWFSFQRSKGRLSIDTGSDSWYFRSMLGCCRKLCSTSHMPHTDFDRFQIS